MHESAKACVVAPVRVLAWSLVVLLGGCAVQPMSPTVSMMPAEEKSSTAFEQDSAVCRDFVDRQTERGNARRGLSRSILAAVLGAVSDEVDKNAGDHGANRAGLGPQLRYDIAYTQCMRARGNQVGTADSAAIAVVNEY